MSGFKRIPVRALPVWLLRAAAATALVVLACDGPTDVPPEPPNGSRLNADQVIGGSLGPSDSVIRYTFAPVAGEEYAVFLRAVEGYVKLSLRDSTQFSPFVEITDSTRDGTVYERTTGTFGAPASGVVTIEVRRTAGGTTRFQLVVYRAKRAPETIPSAFTFGQFVTGEKLEPSADIDEFVHHGDSGQTLLGQVEAMQPSTAGVVAFEVRDGTTGTLLSTATGAGPERLFDRHPTNRITLTATRDYLFRVRAARLATQQWYSGPYQFRVSVVNPAPESLPAGITPGELVSERLDDIGDVDEFSFVAQTGHEFNVFLQSPIQFPPIVQVLGNPELAQRSTASSPADTGLYKHATGRFRIPLTGTYRLRVSGGLGDLSTGAYRLLLYPINRAPEHGPASIVMNDTVSSESIDVPGDIDEFTFQATAGEEFVTRFQVDAGAVLDLELLDGEGTVLDDLETFGRDSTLLKHRTARITATAASTYKVRVVEPNFNQSDHSDRGVAPYRLVVSRINRAPETRPGPLALGDSILGESIDSPGDVDQWTFTVSDSTWVNLSVKIEPGAFGKAMKAEFVNDTGAVVGETATYLLTKLDPGAYQLVVDGSSFDDRSLFRGPYSVRLYPFKSGPESRTATFAIGDTVSGEGIAPLGDFDSFQFHALRGQHVNFAFQGIGAPNGCQLAGYITVGSDGGVIVSTPGAPSLDDKQSNRIDVPTDAWYQVNVNGSTGPSLCTGQYRFAVRPVGVAPEHVSANVSAGDVIAAEVIDAPGDWDEFTLTGTPGQQVALTFKSLAPTVYPDFPILSVSNPATGDTIGTTFGQSFETAIGRASIPAGGQLRLAVFERRGGVVALQGCADPQCTGAYQYTGGYRVRIVPIDSAPETAPATLVVGDTAREAIEPIGDVDVFTFAGSAGQTVGLYLQVSTVDLSQPGILVDVTDAAGTTLIKSFESHGVAIGSGDLPLGTVNLPATATYRVRVQAQSDRSGSGSYRLRLAPG